MSVCVAGRLGWRRRGASGAILGACGRMKPGDAQRDCDAREDAAVEDVRRDSRLSGTRVPADCLT